VNFDGKVWATQLALHALDTGFEVFYRSHESFHFKNLLRAKLHTDMAALAVFSIISMRGSFFSSDIGKAPFYS